MTVKELIEKLESYKNPDLKIYINNSFDDISYISLYKKGITINTDPYFSEDDYWDLSDYRGTSIDADQLETI